MMPCALVDGVPTWINLPEVGVTEAAVEGWKRKGAFGSNVWP